VADAKVEITDGPNAGKQAQTSNSGEFTFLGLAPSTLALRISKPGYVTRDTSVTLDTDGRQTFQLDPPPPPVAVLTVQIDGAGSKIAIIGYSPVRYSAAVTPNDQNTYLIDFGDGTVHSGATAIHPCMDTVIHKPRLTVTDPIGQTSTATAPPVSCMDLVWFYGWKAGVALPGYTVPPRLTLKFETRTGPDFTGFFSVFDASGVGSNQTQPFTATLSGDRSIRIVLKDGSTLTGMVLLDPVGEYLIVVTANGGILDGRTLKFSYYYPF
jgi:hypothetical protein